MQITNPLDIIMEINTNNILRAIALMETIPEERIDMRVYREGEVSVFTHVCRTNGCVIGFCTELDTEENLKLFKSSEFGFEYDGWSMNFFSLKGNRELWNFMFSAKWPNNKKQIIKRMQWVADGNEIPESFTSSLSLYDYDIVLP